MPPRSKQNSRSDAAATRQTAVREKTEFEADYRVVHPDGPVRDIHVVAHPVLSTSGHLVEFLGTVIDVTKRKTAEEKIREQEMELRQMRPRTSTGYRTWTRW